MRPALTTVALWLVVAVAAAFGGAATVLATGTTTTPVLTPEQVAERLAKQDAAIGDDPDDPDVVADDEAWTMPTEAGHVTVICSGDIIASDAVTPASGWEFTGPRGDADGKRQVVFTDDSGADTITIAYTCRDGKVDWDTGRG